MILAFILINGIILGIERSPSLVKHEGDLMQLENHLILGIFIVEALLKMIDVVINNLNEAKAERLVELQGPVISKEILTDLRETQKAIKGLEMALS